MAETDYELIVAFYSENGTRFEKIDRYNCGKNLGVKNETLNEFGAVSEAVVKQMTNGALNKATKATIAVAVSGIAGPDGGTLTKPVGTVWMAVQRRGEESRATLLQLHGSRDEIRLQTTLHALKALIETTVA